MRENRINSESGIETYTIIIASAAFVNNVRRSNLVEEVMRPCIISVFQNLNVLIIFLDSQKTF